MNRRHWRRDRPRRGSEYGLTGPRRRKATNSLMSRSMRSPQPPGKGAPAGRQGRTRTAPWRRRSA
eukprot:7902516-Pyramimonas_sp.AAC.1